ncbi:heme ABC transporter substrate-binding protein IsdE [Eubacterium sp. MSJ-13]|uniref:heme ABC transporter substrate-binding protein IsdE n=1 Tax=Eubacterium sp. MSJ-13 TaxID=2841513 RepID=UPI0020A198B8|nr:heme ABC transporter substrate-binding protein IsdE [Eubacterium sp. MSJ-13]
MMKNEVIKNKLIKNGVIQNKHKKNNLLNIVVILCFSLSFLLSGCVNQHPDKETTSTKEIVASGKEMSANDNSSADGRETSVNDNSSADEKGTSANDNSSTDIDINSMLEITDKSEKAAVESAKEKVSKLGRNPRIIATSPAIADICDRLNIDLAGVCSSTVSTIPSRYKNVKKIGTAMSPDMEIVSSVQPDWILSPSSLQSDLKPKYEAIDTEWAFLNLKSVQGMYRSIQELGIIFDREKEADSLINEFVTFYKKYKSENKTKSRPKVLILMGLPGSYIIATSNSYVGNLVELAGGENVYSDTKQEFLTVNTEDMKKKEPDIILRAAHAMPEQVIKMFNDDFKKNDIWKHFKAVKEGRVYDLSYDKFGMSATFKYKEALAELKQDFECPLY